jgi:hypothetical protein
MRHMPSKVVTRLIRREYGKNGCSGSFGYSGDVRVKQWLTAAVRQTARWEQRG